MSALSKFQAIVPTGEDELDAQIVPLLEMLAEVEMGNAIDEEKFEALVTALESRFQTRSVGDEKASAIKEMVAYAKGVKPPKKGQPLDTGDRPDPNS